jgi:Ca-activated chloride channel family protein
MNIFRFEHSEYLYGLILIPLLIIFWVAIQRLQKKKWNQFGDTGLVNRLLPELSYRSKNWKFTIILFALASLFLAMANPQIGSKIEKVQRKGIDMIIAVDISNSMLAEDIKPNRLSNSKRAISKLVDELSGDRIGIIVFAGKAYTQLPITTDYGAAKMFLSTVNTDFISTQGTSIASAIEMGRTTFSTEGGNENRQERNKAIVIITDGEDHEEGAIEEAEEARKEGIKIYTIGMGTLVGAPIPEIRDGKRIGFKTDNEGHTVISRFNETLLQSIASAGDGIYVRADNNQSGLKLILEEINKMEKTEIETQTFKDYESRFQILAAISLFFLFIETLIGERKRNRFNLNLFNTDEKQ